MYRVAALWLAPEGSRRAAAAPLEAYTYEENHGVIGDIRNDARWDARHDERGADRMDARVPHRNDRGYSFRFVLR
jgi:hypothetical protein